MKIDSSFNNANMLISNKSATRTSKSLGNSELNSSASSNVQLSDYLQLHDANTGSASTFNAAKVEEIKAAIVEGRYQVNTNEIADSLIATARDILKTQQSI